MIMSNNSRFLFSNNFNSFAVLLFILIYIFKFVFYFLKKERERERVYNNNNKKKKTNSERKHSKALNLKHKLKVLLAYRNTRAHTEEKKYCHEYFHKIFIINEPFTKLMTQNFFLFHF